MQYVFCKIIMIFILDFFFTPLLAYYFVVHTLVFPCLLLRLFFFNLYTNLQYMGTNTFAQLHTVSVLQMQLDISSVSFMDGFVGPPYIILCFSTFFFNQPSNRKCICSGDWTNIGPFVSLLLEHFIQIIHLHHDKWQNITEQEIILFKIVTWSVMTAIYVV